MPLFSPSISSPGIVHLGFFYFLFPLRVSFARAWFIYLLLFCRFSAWLLLLEEAQGLGENVCELLSNILFVVSFFCCSTSCLFFLSFLFLVGNVMRITQVLHHPLMSHQLARLPHPVILQCLLLLPVAVRLFVRKIAPCVNSFAQQEEVIKSYSTFLLFMWELHLYFYFPLYIIMLWTANLYL